MGCPSVCLQSSTHYGLSRCLPNEQYTLWVVTLSPYRTVHTMGCHVVSLQNSTHYGPSLCLPTEQYTLWAARMSPYITVYTMGCPFVSLQNSTHYGLSLCLPTEQYTLWAVPFAVHIHIQKTCSSNRVKDDVCLRHCDNVTRKLTILFGGAGVLFQETRPAPLSQQT